MGVPAAFCYIAPWSGGVFMTGDKRMTDSFCDQVEEILQSLNSDDGKPQPEHNVGLCLPKLPAPLETLNGRTLQSILIAIAKDLKLSWGGEKPVFWPEDLPFCNPHTVPEKFRGSWSTTMRQIIRSAYSYCHLNVDEWVEPEEAIPSPPDAPSQPESPSQPHGSPSPQSSPLLSPQGSSPLVYDDPPSPVSPLSPLPPTPLISPLPKTPAKRQLPSPAANYQPPPKRGRQNNQFTPLALRREKRSKKLPKKLLE